MRLLLIILTASVSLSSTAQINFVSYKPAEKNEVNKLEPNLWQAQKELPSSTNSNKLFMAEEKLVRLEQKNDDLVRENQELKKALLTVQINTYLSNNNQPNKKEHREIEIESLYDY